MPDVIVSFEGEWGNHARGYFVVSDIDETQRCKNVRFASWSLPFSCFLFFFFFEQAGKFTSRVVSSALLNTRELQSII